MKHPNEGNQVNDPNYYKYYHLVSHLMEKCFIIKDKNRLVKKYYIKVHFSPNVYNKEQIFI